MAKVAKRRCLLVARAGGVIEGTGFRPSLRSVTALITAVYRDPGSIRWLGKGFWAVSDQGLFAASNFALSVLLARWLSPQDYGAFAAAFAVFLFVGTLHTGLLTEPMLVFGSGRYEKRLSEYLGTLLYGHAAYGLLSGFMLLLAGLGFVLVGSRVLASVFLALALAGPLILLLWLVRRASYARFKPHLAASGGALYMALMLVGAYTLYRFEWLSPASALGIMGFASLAVSLWLVIRLRVERPSLRDGGLAREALENHWKYGRWSVASQALTWAPGYVYYLILPFWGGLEASASLRALMNLILPLLMALQAMSTILIPSLGTARGEAKFGVLVRFAVVAFVLGSVSYWLLLGLLHDPLIAWLYNGRYAENAGLLWILGLMPVSAGVVHTLGAALRSLERPDLVFRAYLFSSALALTLGVAMAFVWGLVGAVVGLLIYSVCSAVAMIYQFAAHGMGSKVDEDYR